MNAALQLNDGARDFDFLIGRWRIHNRRLRQRLKRCTEWDEFDAMHAARLLPGGLGNQDEYRTDFWPGFVGMSFRFFNPATKRWAIYWADNQRGTLEPPVFGAFKGDIAVFEGHDTFEGRPILVRFTWSAVRSPKPRWEQAFSTDVGTTWETNWVMEFARLDGEA
jgi:hypothetical protein